MDNKAAVRAILEDAASDPMDDWRHTSRDAGAKSIDASATKEGQE